MDIDTSKEVFADEKVHLLGVDVDTTGKGLLISKLKKLKSTINVSDGGMYFEDRTISQVHVDTTMNEDALDEWLYNVSFPRGDFDIHGTFER